MIVCQNCGHEGELVYCSNCGQPLKAKRINLPHLLHEVSHTFWHLEKGFLYTLKELAIHPGTMQKRYLSGLRLHYQKPFSLFAISATLGALVLFFIYRDAKEEINQFYKHYYFIVQAAMLPLYAFITYLLFKSPKLYYAEALVMNVYMLGFMSVCIVPINVLYLIFPEYVIQKLEVIFLISYNTWTFLNFFRGTPVWWITLKSIVSLVVSYLLFQFFSNLVMDLFL
jgi:hypothetical protein